MWFSFIYIFFTGFSTGYSINPKISAITQMTRISHNFIPTTALTVLSISPKQPINIYSFMTSFTMVHLLSSVSMVLNDIYDIDTDRINHPERPLIDGRVSIKEAKITSAVLTSAYIFFGTKLQKSLVPFWTIPLAIIYLYTPILKRITLVKNLSCAGVIATTASFIGKSAHQGISLNTKYLTHYVFLWSMFIELLMDISDEKGDSLAGIKTVPVVFGKKITILFIQTFLVASQISFLFSKKPWLAGIHFIFYKYLFGIVKKEYDREQIKKACREITYVLLLFGMFI